MKTSGERGNQMTAKKCCYCHSYGHLVKECKAKKACFRCGEEGHLIRDCTMPERQGEARPFKGCRLCGDTSHWRRDCDVAQALSAYGIDIQRVKFCKKCKKYGHHQEFCQQVQLDEQHGGERPDHDVVINANVPRIDCSEQPEVGDPEEGIRFTHAKPGSEKDGVDAAGTSGSETEFQRRDGAWSNSADELLNDQPINIGQVSNSQYPIFAVHPAYVYVPLYPDPQVPGLFVNNAFAHVPVTHTSGWGGGNYPFGLSAIHQGQILPLVAHASVENGVWIPPQQHNTETGWARF